MFVVKDPKYIINAFEEDNPTRSPTFLFFDSCISGKHHSFDKIGVKIISYLMKTVNYEITKRGGTKDVLKKYGYVPEGMYKYVLYSIDKILFLINIYRVISYSTGK